MTIGEALRQAPPVEAEVLLTVAFVRAGLSRPLRHELYARAADVCSEAVEKAFGAMLAERRQGIPLQYVAGEQTFLDHVYSVTKDVLIPRPETEALVLQAIAELKSPVLGLEIGIGSGIISIELLSRFATLMMVATEVSPEAAKVAQKNSRAILGPGASRLQILPVRLDDRHYVCEPFSERLTPPADFLISNPPYLTGPEEAEEQVIKHEPNLALWSPEGDPVYFYRAMAREAAMLIHPGAPVFVEIPHERAKEVRGVFTSLGWGVTMMPDLTGRDRVLVARK